ncbi:putative porin [Cellulophaga sp. Hel_I_12]|uniref:putative porin n=1 Tax=Cellulophaga sp. Hel_I_12 TaxID=1249972 RepID=UPI000648172E|nr:putative porin [Cellulophaga sp. Hel_I_12]
MKYIILIVVFLSINFFFGQEDQISKSQSADSLGVMNKDFSESQEVNKVLESDKMPITSYKIISFKRDTTHIDTTLTLQKEYTYNYLRKDDFELLPFSNMGRPYTSLGLNFESSFFYPKIGATARHFNYLELEAVNYYDVPTPMTEAMFKTTMTEGQLLDILLTFNLSKRFNYSIAYKGFRSLGKYRWSQSESGNFVTTANYETLNNRYSLRMHIAAQDLVDQENGGLSDKTQFESGDADFQDRSRLDVNLTDATNKILGKRYFFQHQYKLLRKEKDSSSIEKTSLSIGHLFNYETKFYQFNQTTPNNFFGDAFSTSEIADKAHLKTLYNELNAEFYNSILGRLKGSINIYNYNYYFNSLLITDTQRIPNQLKGEDIALGADYEKKIGGFQLRGNMSYNLSGTLSGSLFNASAGYQLNDKLGLSAAIFSSTKMPDFNFLLYQSDYENYNWNTSETFEKVKTNSIEFNLNSKLFGQATAKFTRLDNQPYFAVDPLQELLAGESENKYIKPFQETSSINYLKVKYQKEFKYKSFALQNTLMYQTVSQSNNILNIPEFTTRNTLYFSKEIFKKAMFLQTGVSFKYFTSYTMNAYSPLLGEFYIQNDQKLGGFPMLDFFVNAKVQQTRIYLKAEHFNSSFSEPNYYSAPEYPYRDFIVRFGVVWNFFS